MSKETIETIIQENINVKKDFLNSKSEIEILKGIILLVNDTLQKETKFYLLETVVLQLMLSI